MIFPEEDIVYGETRIWLAFSSSGVTLKDFGSNQEKEHQPIQSDFC